MFTDIIIYNFHIPFDRLLQYPGPISPKKIKWKYSHFPWIFSFEFIKWNKVSKESNGKKWILFEKNWKYFQCKKTVKINSVFHSKNWIIKIFQDWEIIICINIVKRVENYFDNMRLKKAYKSTKFRFSRLYLVFIHILCWFSTQRLRWDIH